MTLKRYSVHREPNKIILNQKTRGETMLCPNCNKPMKNIMHFEKEKCYQFNLCRNCFKKTKNKRIHYEDIVETPSKPNKIK